MAHCSTVLEQMLKLLPRHAFDRLAEAHHQGRKLRKMSRWSQLVAMATAQLTGRASLRDLLGNLSAQAGKFYHLGIGLVSRSSLARVNEKQPWTLYEALFFKLLGRCQARAPRHGFKFRNKLYSLDASTIDLCLSVFPWAKFWRRKGAIKLHVGLGHGGMLPEFVSVTEGRTHDITEARTLALPSGSIVVFDRGYTDYTWYKQLNDREISFVTRQKKNARYRVIERREVAQGQHLSCDQTIVLTSAKGEYCPIRLRRQEVCLFDQNFKLAAGTIAAIYKSRWQIELFFKWIKQNLKIKSFLGTSKNAVMTQIWIAMCVYLMLAYLKFISASGRSLQQIVRLPQLNLFERRPLMELIDSSLPEPEPPSPQQALAFG